MGKSDYSVGARFTLWKSSHCCHRSPQRCDDDDDAIERVFDYIFRNQILKSWHGISSLGGNSKFGLSERISVLTFDTAKKRAAALIENCNQSSNILSDLINLDISSHRTSRSRVNQDEWNVCAYAAPPTVDTLVENRWGMSKMSNKFHSTITNTRCGCALQMIGGQAGKELHVPTGWKSIRCIIWYRVCMIAFSFELNWPHQSFIASIIDLPWRELELMRVRSKICYIEVFAIAHQSFSGNELSRWLQSPAD